MIKLNFSELNQEECYFISSSRKVKNLPNNTYQTREAALEQAKVMSEYEKKKYYVIKCSFSYELTNEVGEMYPE